MADDFSFEIKKSCGSISESKGGWKLELNYVSWGGRDASTTLGHGRPTT